MNHHERLEMPRKQKAPTYPDFLIIGAQKAGTTWLYRNLYPHPQVWMPKEKELHYFDEKLWETDSSLKTRLKGKRMVDDRWRRQARRQLKAYRNRGLSRKDVVWDLRYFLGKPGDEWYASLFEQGDGRVCGEATPDYSILDPETIAHVHELMPETKIIFMMRNPIERAWSQTLMEIGWEKNVEDLPFPRLNRHFVAVRSRVFTNYLRTLENWREFYPEEQIFVGFLEDANFHPNQLMLRLYEFLGVDPSIEYRVIERKIHTRDVDLMQKRSAIRLARIYREQIRRLDESFGGYASFWHYCARRLDEDPPRLKTIPYPLTESFLWDEWVSSTGQNPGSGEAEAQSGPLASIRVKN